jgi:hypothetical protein
MQVSVMANAKLKMPPKTPTSASKPPLTVGEYYHMVSSAYRATGGAIGRVQAEICVAVTLRKLLGLSRVCGAKNETS